MRMCSGVPIVRRAGLLLTWAVLVCAASPGWATPRFGRPGTYAVDGAPIGISAAALDAQAGRDLVTVNEAGTAGPSLSILLNRGQGSFFSDQRMTVSAEQYIVQAIASGDFDADGLGDLAVAVDDVTALPLRGTVLIYHNTGGAFAAPVPVALNGFFARAITAADVTGDGVLDLVVAYAHTGDTAIGQISVLAGQSSSGKPTGAFKLLLTVGVGTAPTALSVGDLDADGHADVVVADHDGGRVYVLYGSGTPADPLEAPIELTNLTAPIAALIDVLPGGALPQVLVGTQNNGKLSRFAQTAPRQFAAPVDQRVGLLPVAMDLADLTGDNVPDLVVLSALGAEMWTGGADGSFSFGETMLDDDSLDGLVLADLNGDAKIDLAASATTQDQVTVVLNGADVPFTPSPTATITATPTRTAVLTATPTPLAGCTGDCNGDGQVSISDLIQGVNIALGNAAIGSCRAFDRDGNGQVTVSELIAGVNSALASCSAP
jgi:hypothetical protein